MTTTENSPLSLTSRYQLPEGTTYLTGLQALVRIPIEQHRLDQRSGIESATLISGYEGSPLAGLDLELAKRSEMLDAHNITFIPAVNEELGANAVQGSQLVSTVDGQRFDGVVGIWYGKAPGLDRATDALRHANLGGSAPNGGVLVLTGDDSTAKSSTVPSSSEAAMAEIGMTVLAPSDPQDVLDLGLHGIAMSRFSGLWSGLKLATNVVDGASTTEVSADRVTPTIPDRTVDGSEFHHTVTARFLQPKLGELERSMNGSRAELARRYAHANGLNRIFGDPKAKVGIISAGASYLDVRQALRLIGIPDSDLSVSGIRLLKLGLVSPLEPRILNEFAQDLDEILIVEEKRAFIELGVKDLLYDTPGAPAIYGKRGPDGSELLRAHGDLPPDLIAGAIAPRLQAHGASPAISRWLAKRSEKTERRQLPLLQRTPYFCSGCPHNRSTAVPDGSLVGAGIGCHALAALMPSEQVGNIIGMAQMGGEGAPWIGMAPFVTHSHLIQNLGDGTFHHSGSLAIRAAVAAGANITYKLLYNDAVAMTGGQAAVGKMTVPQIARELLAEGVVRVVVTTEDPKRYRRVKLPRGAELRHRDRLIETQQELAATEGVTVLIHDQECATELRRKRKRKLVEEPAQRVFINERVCEGCGDCGVKSNCLSVQPVTTKYGRKTKIDQATCNKDFSCLDGDCPSFITVIPSGEPRRHKSAGTSLRAEDLPEPKSVVRSDEFCLRMTGIGGTGVVTAAQIIASAAASGGAYVRSLDQLGMAQKGGAVVSDIRISSSSEPAANKVAAGECDLYLGCDILVAAAESNLEVASPDRTVAVVSTSAVPTGAMVQDTSVTFPPASDTVGRIDATTRTDVNVFADVRALASGLFGTDQSANIFLIGMAVQAGALPVSAALLEEAIEANGVAVEANLQAFRWGRQQVADPQAVRDRLQMRPPGLANRRAAQAVAALVDCEAGTALREVVEDRVEELRKYQNLRYARRYALSVETVRQQEVALRGSQGEITVGFAKNLFKLMAYKDEYEVARLSLDPSVARAIQAEFGPGAKYSFNLHPPVLRALGMRRKLKVSSRARFIFSVLYALRWLRGTALDPFGYGNVRRTERALIEEYTAAVEDALSSAPTDFGRIEELVELPDMVRGYEHVKLANVERFRSSLAGASTGSD